MFEAIRRYLFAQRRLRAVSKELGGSMVVSTTILHDDERSYAIAHGASAHKSFVRAQQDAPQGVLYRATEQCYLVLPGFHIRVR